MAKKKRQNPLLRKSIIFWIVVFVLYAAILTPFAPKIASWPKWGGTLLLVLLIAVPVIIQIIFIIIHYQDEP